VGRRSADARAHRADRRERRAKAVDYVGAGTIEGLFSLVGEGASEPEYFFLEMNTRVQVEHCVTEMTTGIDIVKEGIRAAAGEPLSYAQEDVELRGHAIECRINAEDALQELRPGAGRIGATASRAGPGVRVDSGVGAGGESLADVRPDGREADRLGQRP
jgi:acetyl-CoA/propionyl-CoA carboxylase biotin carboxyl carrier protein